jgi:hypothetical protein
MGLIRSVFVMGISLGLAVAAQARDSESKAAASIAQRFAALAGGNQENALALTLALRNGDRVTLVQDDGGSRVPVTSVFELPAREMQWDEVVLCLALVEDMLASEGIRNPSPEQLEIALLRVVQSLADGLGPVPKGIRVRGKGG